ncbi:MAG: hypothetical protein WB460_04025 [Candidatus Acidiferrales bacterium]
MILFLIFLVLGLGFSLRFGNYWAAIPFRRKKGRKQASLMAQWRRPSTILLALLIGYTIYTRSISRWTEMAIIVFFVLRYWEYDAFAVDDIPESDVDNAHDEVLGADPAPKEKHWYDDVND